MITETEVRELVTLGRKALQMALSARREGVTSTSLRVELQEQREIYAELLTEAPTEAADQVQRLIDDFDDLLRRMTN